MPFLEGDESGEYVAAAVGSNLPCVISAGKNILTPDLLGIQFTKSIACSFDNSLQVGMIEFQLKETDGSYSDIYKWRPQGGSAGGYRKSINPSGDYSDPNATTNQPPAPVLNVPIYYGKMQSIDFQCYCFIYEITDQVEVTPTGSGADGITSQYTVQLPLSYNNSVFKYRTPAHSSHCSDITPPVADLPSMLDGLLEEHIDAVTGKNTGGVEVAIDRNNLDAYIDRVMAFYEANGYHGNVLLYNESTSNQSSTNRTLTEYKPGELPITYGSNSTIQTKLTAFENGAFTSTDFGILIDASGSGNARVTVNFKQGFLAPLSTVTNPLVLEVGLENISTVGEDVYRDDLKDFVLGKLHVNGQLESSIYQNEGFTPQVTGPYDGRFRVIESSGGMEWLGFAMAELGHVIKKAEVDASLWNPKEQNIYDNKLINMYAPIGGVIDQGLIEVKDLYDMYGLCKQFIDKPKETAGELYNHFANMSAGEIVYMLALEDIDQYRTNYNNAILGEEKQYAGIRAAMYTTITAIKVVAGSSLLLVIRESGDIFELFDGIRVKANPDLDVKIRELSSAKKGKFQEDFKRDSPEEMQELLSHFDENPELVGAWESIFPDELLRKNTDNLAKVENYANDFGKNFDDIGDEFTNVPSSQRSGWVDHLEYRTKSNGGVNKAGGQSSKYGTYADNSSVPSKYSSDNRFDDLAADPAVGNTTPKTRQEAMAGLEAESQGILSSPISREPSGNMEFFDGNGSPWDVKGPRGGNFFNVDQVGASIRRELRDKGPFPNGTSGVPEPRKVLLDCTYIDASELSSLRSWLQNNLDASEFGRIKEINSNLF